MLKHKVIFGLMSFSLCAGLAWTAQAYDVAPQIPSYESVTWPTSSIYDGNYNYSQALSLLDKASWKHYAFRPDAFTLTKDPATISTTPKPRTTAAKKPVASNITPTPASKSVAATQTRQSARSTETPASASGREVSSPVSYPSRMPSGGPASVHTPSMNKVMPSTEAKTSSPTTTVVGSSSVTQVEPHPAGIREPRKPGNMLPLVEIKPTL